MAKEKAKVNISLDDSLFSIENDEVKEDNRIDSSRETNAELHEENKGSEGYLIAK